MVAGKRYFNGGNSGGDEEAERTGRIIKEYMAISGALVVSDMTPVPKWIDGRHALKRAQEELDLVVGKERWVEDTDIKNLVYLQAIVKETLRLYPPGPLAAPHEAMEDSNVCGYNVQKGTRLFVNVWKLHRDPNFWPDPEVLLPERFLTSQTGIDASGLHFEFIPFGSGRRACPGINFAFQVIHLTLVSKGLNWQGH
ncbi:hypothetical protein FNV43_RR23032 [Rhamnella rubrinervis]|uniref:Cytochrome P450 n=1 Tax=Rhamnella rubrinervis TaxID=2594499 RepID=A0A8K0GVN8_9ROSA|nr:hypothetical protein FNV43_RR23032 [Rhamnella rubrinervis]